MVKNKIKDLRKSNFLGLLVGFSITIPFVLYALLKMDLQKSLAVLEGIKLHLIFPVVLSMCFSFLFRAICWSNLLDSIKIIHLYRLFKAIVIGFFGNMIYPVRLGEIIRTFIISKQEKIRFSGVFATVVVTRVMDLLNAAIFSLIAIFIFRPPSISISFLEGVNLNAKIVVVVSLVIFLICYTFSLREGKLNGIITKLGTIVPSKFSTKLKSHYDSFLDGLNNLQKPTKVITALSFSFLMWCASAAAFYFSLLMFSFEATIGKSAILTTALAFGKLIPSSPGFIGPLQASIVFALSLYGMDKSIALGFAIAYHGITFLSAFLLALFCLWSNRMSLFKIKSSINQISH